MRRKGKGLRTETLPPSRMQYTAPGPPFRGSLDQRAAEVDELQNVSTGRPVRTLRPVATLDRFAYHLAMTAENVSQPRLRWKTVVIAWVAFGLYMAAQGVFSRVYRGLNPAWNAVVVSEVLYALLWIPLTPLVVWLVNRFRFEPPHRARNLLLHVLASLLLSFAHRVVFLIALALYEHFAQGSPMAVNFSALVVYVDYGVLLYWIIWLISVSVAYAEKVREREVRAAELETRLARAQVHALQSQLQPHFLFNTLNAISALVTKDPAAARGTITLLSGLMRETLALGSLQEVPLSRELALTQQYLDIEKQRFGDRLTVRVNVDPSVQNSLVPSLILQPLLENAFKHGLSQRRGDVRIDITAARVDGTLRLSVWNDGSGIRTDAGPNSGVGLQNTRARLERLYGDRAAFELREEEEGRVRADMTVPLHEEPVHG